MFTYSQTISVNSVWTSRNTDYYLFISVSWNTRHHPWLSLKRNFAGDPSAKRTTRSWCRKSKYRWSLGNLKLSWQSVCEVFLNTFHVWSMRKPVCWYEELNLFFNKAFDINVVLKWAAITGKKLDNMLYQKVHLLIEKTLWKVTKSTLRL